MRARRGRYEDGPTRPHVRGSLRARRAGVILTEPDLRAVFDTASVHCRPGGSAVFVPDYLTETFAVRTSHGGHDSEDGARGLRYLEWVRADASDPTRHVVDFAYLLREGETVRVEHDRHLCGLFPRETWLRGLDAAGFDVNAVEPDYEEPTSQVVFACQRRA